MTELVNKLSSLEIEYSISEPLSVHSTFRIGGTADVAVFPESEKELVAALRACVDCKVKYTVIGNASNVLFSDNGYRGAIIFTRAMNGVEVRKKENGATFLCEAGASLAHIANIAANEGYAGLEFLHGIPATLGGAICMNAGAFASEISSVIISARVYDTQKNEIVTFVPSELKLSYRHSAFMERRELVCLSAELCATAAEPEDIKQKMREYKEKRLSTQPYTSASAGSFFKRPEGHFAAKLIDDCGLKGLSVGGAEVSKKHAGFIVNNGGATARDVLELASAVKSRVFERYGVLLEREVIYIEE